MSLTPEQIENWREYIILLVGNTAPQKAVDRAQVNEIFDTALSSARKDKALRELVRLKDLKDQIETGNPPWETDSALGKAIRECERCKPLAWSEARAAVEEAGQTEPDPFIL